MVSTDNGELKEEIEESNGSKVEGLVPLHISTSQRGLISDEDTKKGFKKRFLGRVRLLKFGSAKFRQLAEGRDELSRAVPSSSHHIRERFNEVFMRKIDWVSLRKMCKEWIRDPMNMALFAWIVCVAVSGAILFLVMTGMLNHELPKKSQRDAWFEVNNQILNALFTLMCLYQHPKRFYHLVLLCRWRPEDISKLRKIYCKNGTYKPHEWAHMMVVVILLHINCFAQYALCGLNLGYRRSERPAIGVGICIAVAIGAPAIAGVYTIVSPLGKEYDSETDEEAQVPITTDSNRVVESRPEWSGGEVRTGNSYDIVENTFCRKKMDGGSQLPISPLPREDELANSPEILEEVDASNQRVVRALYEALGSRDVDTVHRLLAADLEWWFHGPPSHQFMMRLLTGVSSDESFVFEPLAFASFGSTVLAEGCDHSGSIAWVHAWTVTDGVITQVREYFNTSLTVTRLSNSDFTTSPSSSISAASSSSTPSPPSRHCPSVWESSFSDRVGKSVPVQGSVWLFCFFIQCVLVIQYFGCSIVPCVRVWKNQSDGDAFLVISSSPVCNKMVSYFNKYVFLRLPYFDLRVLDVTCRT
ncbi:unnamed protein product, partial [Vitis vinifera]